MIQYGSESLWLPFELKLSKNLRSWDARFKHTKKVNNWNQASSVANKPMSKLPSKLSFLFLFLYIELHAASTIADKICETMSKSSSKIGRDEKASQSVCVSFLTTSIKFLFLEGRLGTRLCLLLFL